MDNSDKPKEEKRKCTPEELRAIRIANMRPIKKGQVLNPLGRKTGSYNTILPHLRRELLAEFTPTDIVLKKAEEQGIDLTNVRGPRAKIVALALVQRAMVGDMRAVEIILDRVDGKATVPLELSGPGGQPLTLLAMLAAKAKITTDDGGENNDDEDNSGTGV